MSSEHFAKNPFPFPATAEEAYQKGTLEQAVYDKLTAQYTQIANNHPELEKWYREAQRSGYIAEELLTKGAASVVALVQTAVIDNVFPLLVGRQVSTVVPVEVGTAGTSVTFYRRKAAAPQVASGVGATMRAGARYDTQNITIDEIIEDTMEWDRSFVPSRRARALEATPTPSRMQPPQTTSGTRRSHQ